MTNVSTAANGAFLLRSWDCERKLLTQLWVSECRKRRKEARIPLGSTDATSRIQQGDALLVSKAEN